MKQCANSKCGKSFAPRSVSHFFCSDACRRAVRGNDYRKARERALLRDGFACTECGATSPLEVHHKTPVCRGGGHELSNLQTLCRKHHKAKHRSWRANAYEYTQRQAATRGGTSRDTAA